MQKDACGDHEGKKCHIRCISRQNTKKLCAYGAVSPLEVIGTFTADITMGNKCVSAEVSRLSRVKGSHF